MPQPRASGSSGPSGRQAATPPPPSSSSTSAPSPPAAAQQRTRTRRRHHHHHHLVVLSVLAFLVALARPVLAAPTRAEAVDAKQLLHRAIPDDPTQWTKRDTREAFARIVDPLAPWGVALGAVSANSAAGRGAGVVEGENSGWLTHWLSMGGEGVLTVMLGDDDNVNDDSNITLPHRPAAFPNYLSASSDLPVNGTLVPFASLPAPKSPKQGDADDSNVAAHGSWDDENKGDDDGGLGPTLPPERACLPPAWPPIRPRAPKAPYLVVLVERGGCDFATKVRAAQERGAAAVVVGDGVARAGESDEEGRRRENLITMFSPEDTSGIIIPSVFVSRASYLALRDLLANHTIDGRPGLRVEVGEAADDGSALGSLLTFALLMPSLFLLATVAAHRVRVARQREANRAPPTVVLSLPERVWSPDIVWEKDDSDESDKEPTAPTPAPAAAADVSAATASEAVVTGASPPVVDSANESPAAADADDEADPPAAGAPPSATPAAAAAPPTSRKRGKERRKSKKYYSKDECAICMDNFHRGEIVRILPCGHVFHKDECDEWLLKWRKLCPTCRADVTLPPGDLSSSATLTPVVDRTAAPTPGAATNAERGRAGYGAVDGNTDSDEGEGGWGDQLAAGIQSVQTRVGMAAGWVRESFQAVVRRGDAGGVGGGGASGAGGGGQRNERTPLVGGGDA